MPGKNREAMTSSMVHIVFSVIVMETKVANIIVIIEKIAGMDSKIRLALYACLYFLT